jgi:hypothetical protein
MVFRFRLIKLKQKVFPQTTVSVALNANLHLQGVDRRAKGTPLAG